MTQNEQILDYLQHNEGITQLDALIQFGCMRLASRINDLRKRGHDIVTNTIERNGKHFAYYTLERK